MFYSLEPMTCLKHMVLDIYLMPFSQVSTTNLRKASFVVSLQVTGENTVSNTGKLILHT